ncbi:anti-phage defense-associated sirtuin Dsr1 [Rhizobium leguminosarum]|uniref:anti-phage defense-associated sirtuin Dsr1 n=1 Tax=Rhizobium leguminosarum TaxID=384 RepID=UPI0015DBC012|nr:anti-phage defense-associated sirtuin Dsr1 [Rhizobium leguminosarum]NZD49838.1 SIR2 family protein [Rhizobium leguminosarum]
MQFVANGPDVPEELLQAHEDGKVVFFCGAGISYPAELPGFRDLVMKIYTEIGEIPDPIEELALAGKSYDTTIALLENRVVDHRIRVRQAIAAILTPNLKRQGATATHEALLTLSRSGDQRLRLITTNFDRLFVEAMKRQGVDYPSYIAPLLPIPKKAKWDGLVYLHGFLPERPSASDLERLVASSGDFGLAYLTERWAARFVSELFRTYTVCFVGYSIDDPVLRYMMDALAADRLIGETSPAAYAFGGCEKGQEDHAAKVWSSKNVRPILYAAGKEHRPLHRTLRAWADSYRDGVRGKESLVIRHGRSKPQGSTKQDDFVGRMLWALSDKSGLPAKAFADIDPPVPIEWLAEFEKAAFRHRDLIRFQVAPNPDENKKLKFSIVERPWPYATAPWMRLVFRRANIGGVADAIMLHLARWLVKHLNDPRTLLWASRNGGILQDNFAHLVQDALDSSAKISPIMRAYWQLLLSGRINDSSVMSDVYNWVRDLKGAGRLTPILRMKLRELLSPRIILSEGYEEEASDKPSIEWELTVGGAHSGSALRDVFRSDVWKAALPFLLADATDLLRDAVEIASSLHDEGDILTTFAQHPSIAPHPQNRPFRDWTVLIDFVRDAWLAAADSLADRAKREFERWDEFGYPIFRRLQFFALASRPELFEVNAVFDRLFSDQGKWLWALETQREVLVLIAVIAGRLDRRDAARLTAKILQGPPIEADDGLPPERQTRRNDREIWRRLGVFRDNGGELSAAASKKLSYFEANYPAWGTVDERDQFAVYMYSGDIERPFERTPVSRSELKIWLTEHRQPNDFDDTDDFVERCRRDFSRTALALLDLAQDGDWIVGRWREALRAWATDKHAKLSWRWVGTHLASAPDDVVAALGHALSGWLQACGAFATSNQDAFFDLANRGFDQHVGDHYEPEGAILSDAFNNPVGQITDGLIKLWFARGVEDGQGLAPQFQSTFGRLCDTGIAGFALGRLFLCSNAIALFRVDEDWTNEHLVGLFDWDVSALEAAIAWSGFLRSPRLYVPFIKRMKADFLNTGEYYEALGELGEQYAGLLTFAALESTDIFTRAEFSRATARLPEDGLVQALQTVTDGLEGAGSKAPEYWDNRVKPYFRYVWPKSQDLVTARISGQIATLIIAAGEKFPEAIGILGGWLQHVDETDFAIHRLHGSDLPSRYPLTALDFLDRTVDRSRMWFRNELARCLDLIVAADPALASDHRLLQLAQLTRR